MPNTENNQNGKSARESILARARERFPDRKFANLDDTEPGDDVDDLDTAIEEMLSEYSVQQSSLNDANGKLMDLLLNDPSSADFIQRWMDTKDPRTALVETFGDDLGLNEEAQEKFKGELDAWREKRSASQTLEKEARKNWQNSLAALDAWGDEKGLSLDEKRDVMVRLLAIAIGGMENNYTTDDFDLALNAIRHDNDVEMARHEGEVAGRNEKIAATRRERTMSDNMPPAAGGGQGGKTPERKPERNSPWAGLK